MDTFLYFVFIALAATSATGTGYNYHQARLIMNQVLSPSSQFDDNVGTAPAPPTVSQYSYMPPANVATDQSAQYLQSHLVAPEQFTSQPSQHISTVQLPPVYSPSEPAISEPQYNDPQQRQTIISSDIYIHSAPEESEEILVDPYANAGPIKTNYRVIFITAPTYKLRFNMNSLQQAQTAHEEKTVIYVMSKKPDTTSFQSQLSAIKTEPKMHRPEVYFINYQTQAEADRAQQEIQAQYNALGGSTTASDEAFAPVIGNGIVNGGSNFVQSASSNQQGFIQPSLLGNQGSASSANFAAAPPSLRYLPAKRK